MEILTCLFFQFSTSGSCLFLISKVFVFDVSLILHNILLKKTNFDFIFLVAANQATSVRSHPYNSLIYSGLG